MVLDTIVGFLFVLTVVVFFHEFGHFLVARWCGVGVKAFSIGFGPEIFGFTDKHATRWKLSWIPLGGYVKFIDDENAASAGGRKALEKLTPEERKQSFQEKPLAARAAVVAAGPIANFVLAIAIFTAIFSLFGERVTAADRKSTRLNSSHLGISYAVFCLKTKKLPNFIASLINRSRLQDIANCVSSSESPLSN